jgi:WD40 repeat protein
LVRRNKGPVAAVSLVLLALVGGFIGTTWGLVRAEKALGELREQQAKTRAAEAAERDKAQKLALSFWRETRTSRQARQPGRRYNSLEALAGAVQQLRSLDQLEVHRDELRDDAIASLTLWDVRPVHRLPVAPLRPLPSVDPLGRLYVAAEAPNVVTWRRLADNQVVHRRQWQGSHCVYLKISPDARHVAALCHDDLRPETAVCRVWDSGTGRLVLERPANYRCGHDFRPDGKVLALAQPDGSIALYDLDAGQELPRLPAGPTPERLRFHPSGRYLAVSTWSPEVVVWDLAAGKVMLRLLGDLRRRGDPVWAPDGSLLAIGGQDNNIHLCTFPEGTVRAVLRGHEHVVTEVEFHPSGRLLASSSHDDTTRLWYFSPDGEVVLPGEKLLGFSRDGRRLFTKSFREITEWEVVGPEGCLHYLPHGQGRSTGPWEIAFAPDGRLLASASQDGVHLWDAAAARRVGRVPSGDGFSLAFHPREGHLFTTGNGGVMQWPIVPGNDRQALRVGPGTVVRATTAGSKSLRINVAGAGESVLLGAGDGGVDLVPLAEPGRARRLGTHDGLFGVALSPDGRWAVTAGRQGYDRPDDAVRIWDVARGTLVHRLPHEGEYPGVAVSPDGRRLVTGVRSEFFFWKVGSWELEARLPRGHRSLFSSIAFTRDGRLLALAQDRNRIGLYNAATLRRLATLEIPGPADLSGLSLSPDGTRLAATTQQNVIALWDLRRLRQGLAALDLDWEMPPYPPAEQAGEPVQALTVEVHGAAKPK